MNYLKTFSARTLCIVNLLVVSVQIVLCIFILRLSLTAFQEMKKAFVLIEESLDLNKTLDKQNETLPFFYKLILYFVIFNLLLLLFQLLSSIGVWFGKRTGFVLMIIFTAILLVISILGFFYEISQGKFFTWNLFISFFFDGYYILLIFALKYRLKAQL